MITVVFINNCSQYNYGIEKLAYYCQLFGNCFFFEIPTDFPNAACFWTETDTIIITVALFYFYLFYLL